MIKNNLESIKKDLPDNVTLVAVSKTKPIKYLLEVYEANQRIFGENKVQELVDKYNNLPKDIEWHFIGHLQTNKVKYIAEFVSLIHAVDSLKLLKEINKQAKKHDRIIDVLLQIKIAEEESKFGLSQIDTLSILEQSSVFNHVNIIGLMGMATFTNNLNQVKSEFKSLNSFFKAIKLDYNNIKELSIGMSNDYTLAIQEGSTMIRVGSKIFGSRN